MSDTKYLNTFAVISFNKDFIYKNNMYEYLSFEENKPNDILKPSAEIIVEQPEEKYRYWILRNDNKLTKVSAMFISDDKLDDIFFGPFESLELMNLFILENNIITEN